MHFSFSPQLVMRIQRKTIFGTSLAVQWLRPHASNAGGVGSIPGQELRSHMPRGTAEKKENHF